MRVGLLIYGTLDTISGGYLYDRKLVEYLQKQGDEIEIVSLPWHSYGRLLADNLLPDLERRLKSLKVDVLLQDELNHPSLFWLNQRLKEKLAYPVISIVHHLRSNEYRPEWQNGIYREFEGAYLRSVDGFIFNSQTTRKAVEQLTGELPRHWQVVYPAGDRFQCDIGEAEIRQRAAEPGPLRVLYIGNVIRRKALRILIEALTLLVGKEWRLTAVGSLKAEPAYVQKVQCQIRLEEVEDRVALRGSVSDTELVELLRAHQVLAVPSSYEGFGIVYLEGMSFGLPAIGTTNGGASEIITHHQDGFLIEPGDASNLAELLHGLQRDRALLLEMSLAARQRYLAHPTWVQSAEVARKFLAELVRQ